MTMFLPPEVLTKLEALSLEFLGSSEEHTEHTQLGTGTPVEVPQPSIVTFMVRVLYQMDLNDCALCHKSRIS